jgi:hypothetical protein
MFNAEKQLLIAVIDVDFTPSSVVRKQTESNCANDGKLRGREPLPSDLAREASPLK